MWLGAHRDLDSSPTRRSSDLNLSVTNGGATAATLDGTHAGAPVRLAGTLTINHSSNLNMKGSIVNTGLINATSGQLRISGTTLSGGGAVQLSGTTVQSLSGTS